MSKCKEEGQKGYNIMQQLLGHNNSFRFFLSKFHRQSSARASGPPTESRATVQSFPKLGWRWPLRWHPHAGTHAIHDLGQQETGAFSLRFKECTQ